MNRVLLLAASVFLAVVLGFMFTQNEAALAGHGCCGCYGGGYGCYGGGCYGGWGGYGCHGGCYGGGYGCHGCGGYGGGYGPPGDGGAKPPPPPPNGKDDGKKAEAKPLGFRTVNFRR